MKPAARHRRGHQVYYERCGTPGATPAVFVHGGPGGGVPTHRRLFDPARYDVLFDQRGCGRSTPMPSWRPTPPGTWWPTWSGCALTGAEQWLVFGGSWGSTLARLCPGPSRAGERLVLRGIYLGTREEADWFYQFGVPQIFRQVGALCGADPARGTRRHAGRLSPAADHRAAGAADRGGAGVEPL
jgi:proline iminopeptidase